MKKNARKVFDIRLLVGLSGLILSVVLHEVFHIAMHFGNITSIHLFPNLSAGVEITSVAPAGYDVMLEEAIAYAISSLTILVTIIVVWKIHDAKDTRTYEQILFSKA